jgi:predicted porin
MKVRIFVAFAAALALAAAGAAEAWEYQAGDWLFGVSGTVNGFYVYRTVDDGAGHKTSNSAVENGLLPAWINFQLSTQTEGWDVKAHFGFAPGINDKSSVVGLPEHADPSTGLSPFSQIDTRNAYLSLGNPSYGTFKFGRDIGLFGQTIILSDMTLLGVGGNANAAVPFNTTFGMISHGYMYVGFQPQITWTAPAIDAANGFHFSAGIFQPNQFSGTETKTPGFQALADYDFKLDPVSGKVWGGFTTQHTDGVGGLTANGYELGVKGGAAGFEGMLYGFQGRGLGASTIGALYFLAQNNSGGRQNSSGWLAQGTYRLGATKFGVSYGENRDKDSPLCNGCDRKTPAVTLGVYHSFNKYVTLTGEYVHEQIKGDGPTTKIDTIALGAILFF